jgi:hypothetical protein
VTASDNIIGGSASWNVNYAGGGKVANVLVSAFTQCLLTAQATDTTTQEVVLEAFQDFFSAGTPSKTVFWFGDSVSDGYIATVSRDADRGLPIRLQGALGGEWVVHCGAKAGWKVADMESSAVTNFDDSTVRESGMTSYAVILGGYNDCFNGADAATILASLQTWVDNRRSAGADKILICTLPLGSGITGSSLTVLGAVNAGIPSLTGHDGVIDLASVSGVVYQGDGIHPTSAGALTLAQAAAPIISAA